MVRYGIICAIWLAVAGQAGGGRHVKDDFLKAIQRGDAAAVRTLLDRDASLARATDDHGVSALLTAVYYRQKEIATILLDTGLELDVFEAAATGRTARVRELVATDPGLVNAFSPDGFPPLGLAVFFGHQETVEALLAAGADPRIVARNAMRVAPIHAAAAAGRADLARMLLDRGADPNARQQAGFAPLHEAASAGNLELARLLVEHGADVNATTDDGRTPLAFAIEKKRDEMARFLREHGAKQ